MNSLKAPPGSKCQVRAESGAFVTACCPFIRLLPPDVVAVVQSLVEDPAACVRETKLRVAEKEGVPVEQQRLIFYTPDAEPAGSSGAAGSISPSSAEELLLSSGRWEVR